MPENIFPQSISGSTSLQYLIPTTSGAGVCTTSLVDFLVLTHNDFIMKCHSREALKDDKLVAKFQDESLVVLLH